MNQIRKLNDTLINQIAAGEVIDRPASIIKELIENSIDAQASKINVIIEDGGHSMVKIIDNGCGIEFKYIKKAFERHATSKIKTIADLNNIHSLGFRGEALPSIASISKVHIKSFRKDVGYSLNIEYGKFGEIIPCSIESGTSIEVRNIFHNVPVRKKFLKSINSEVIAITKLLRQFSLSNCNIEFQFINNKKMIFNYKKSDLLNRISSIYGIDYGKNLFDINFSDNNHEVLGYIGNLSITKRRPGEQYLFVNNRHIKNKSISFSILNGYSSLIERGEYPFYILFINAPPNEIDVNVHPTKTEIKFQNENYICSIIKKIISNTLLDIKEFAPDYSIEKNKLNNYDSQKMFEFESNKVKDRVIEISDVQKEQEIQSSFENKNILQIHNTYLLTEVKEGLVIIDQHVAHERILFEKIMDSFESGMKSQTLLFPQSIQLLPEELESFQEIYLYLEKIGFKAREFGENSIIVEGCPVDIKYGNEVSIIKEILDNYTNTKTKQISSELFHNIASTCACKASIKAGDKLEEEEMNSLIDELFKTANPYFCPHGRPIITKISKNDLDRKFERK